MDAAKVKSDRDVKNALGAPPVIWAAFARQASMKSGVILGLLLLLAMSLLANLRLLGRPPEFVVVENPGGQATLVRQSVATDALLKFLRERTQVPDIAVVRFTRDFLRLAFAVNSSTVEANFQQALAMMTNPMRARVAEQAAKERLVETYKAAQVKTALAIEDILLLTRTPTLLQVKATMVRTKSPLFLGGGADVVDRLAVDLVLETVTPSLDRPDGLAVAEWSIQELKPANDLVPILTARGAAGEGKP